MSPGRTAGVVLHYEIWPGTLGPAAGSPPRRPGTVRRTTSIDSLWPDGVGGDLHLVARGRDLGTGTDGVATVLDTIALSVPTEGRGKLIAGDLRAEPDEPRLVGLVGASAMAGLRKGVATHLPDLDGTLLGLLLDDLPGAALVSGSASIRGDIIRNGLKPMPGMSPPGPAICAGRVAGKVADRSAAAGMPYLGQGPPAPSLLVEDDPLAWHEQPELPPESMRRRRRTDVRVEHDEVHVDSHFRDSYIELDGVETAVHEYEVEAVLAREGLVVRSIEVRARVLPNPDCPGAMASAQRLVGTSIVDVRGRVRAEFRGETTCTHLNDQLRSLADVPFLLRASGL